MERIPRSHHRISSSTRAAFSTHFIASLHSALRHGTKRHLRSLPWSERQDLFDLSIPSKNGQATSQATSSRANQKERSKSSSAAATRSAFACPACQSEVIEREKSFSCSAWKSGCSFTIWKSIAGKNISASMAQKLAKQGKTQVLKGFKSKAGKKFDARLKLENDKVVFDFGE